MEKDDKMLCPLDPLAPSSIIQRRRKRADLTSSVTLPLSAAFHEDPCSPARCVPTTPSDIHYDEYAPRPERDWDIGRGRGPLEPLGRVHWWFSAPVTSLRRDQELGNRWRRGFQFKTQGLSRPC